jgi:uncharacterized protein (DUF885 family)
MSNPTAPRLLARDPSAFSAALLRVPRVRQCSIAALLGLALAATASGCGAPPSAAAPRVTAVSAQALVPTPEDIGRRLLALTPNRARSVGLHEYDGRIGDFSAAGIEQHVQSLRELQRDVATLNARAGSPDDQLDLQVLRQMIAQDLFDLTELESWRTNPAYYSELFSVDEYIVRDYAPKEQRARAMLSHLRSSREQVRQVAANLRSPLSEPVVKTAIDIFKGYGQYLRGDVQRFLDGVADAAVKGETQALATELAGEAEVLAAHFQTQELPRADQSHVLGRERFEHLLLAQEALSTPIEQLEAMAEQDLARNKAAYEDLARRVTKTRPRAGELLDEVRLAVEGARAFVQGHQLVTLPSEPHVEVKETPPFMRWNSAFLNAGGVFDAPELPAYFYVTLPDPSWPPKEQAEYVLSRGQIVSTSVHEVFPGHYLHGLWLRSAPTFVQKVAWSYSFGEGWAHYAEQMMIDQGFRADQPEARLGQLSDALLRNCRFVASIAIHVRGVSLDEVKRRFVDDCKQDEAGARQQAVRGSFDPGYFAYTLGKLQILALREEAKQKLGTRFDLGKFHDALLAHGAPPVPLIHDRVLAALEAP